MPGASPHCMTQVIIKNKRGLLAVKCQSPSRSEVKHSSFSDPFGHPSCEQDEGISHCGHSVFSWLHAVQFRAEVLEGTVSSLNKAHRLTSCRCRRCSSTGSLQVTLRVLSH
jgi:hypothetical protein